MQTHETDPLLAERPRFSPPRRADSDEAMASRAIQAGRPDVLHPGAVLHLQRAAGNASVASFLGEEREEERSPVKDVVGSGGGSPLDRDTRQSMESRFGQDFSDVRVHTDSQAGESARAVNAQAYTVGPDIVFQPGKYAPETHEGKHMLAHELTHVVQQKSGPVSGTPAPGGIQISDPSDSFEQQAERTATQVMSAEPSASSPASVQTLAIQRQEEEEEPQEVQASFVQRQEEEEEPEKTPAP
ncbi:MAG: DUF4157 domain-containing protein [Actinomycetota bacterium]